MSIDDKLAQYEKDLVIANDMVSKLLEEGRKLKEEKKQAESPGFGDEALLNGDPNHKRLVLYDSHGRLSAAKLDSCGRFFFQAHGLSNYTRTGRNIAEFLKTT